MAAQVTVIARAARIQGRLTGDGDVEVQGFLDGELSVDGDVTVDAEGMVSAGIRGRRVVIRGAVKGDVTGSESVVLESGARVVGDLKAPRVAIADGALARGFVQTDDAEAPARAARATASRAAPVQASRAVAPATRAAAPASRAAAPVTRAAASPARSPAKTESASSGEGNGSGSGGAAQRRPPPPVVPALKKLRGQIVKKRER